MPKPRKSSSTGKKTAARIPARRGRPPKKQADAPSSNGHATVAAADPVDDDDDDDDDRFAPGFTTATVDGREARIDTRSAPEPMTFEPAFAELMERFTEARYALEGLIEETRAAKERQKAAQAVVDQLGNKITVAWSQRNQLAFPFAATTPAPSGEAEITLCSACGKEPARVPVANGAMWCVPCVQTALIAPRADTPIDAAPPELSQVIEALADALRAENTPRRDRAADAVEALAADTRELSQIRAELTRIATQFDYDLSLDPPYVRRRDLTLSADEYVSA